MDVLIAEDEQDVADRYSLALKNRGHNTVIAADGEKCLQLYRKASTVGHKTEEHPNHFDVVVLDYSLPKMDGLDTAREILKINPDQRIIFVSAYAKETLRDSISKLEKIMEVVEKPVKPEDLVGIIENTTATQELKMIDAVVRDMEVEHKFIAAKDVHKGIARMRIIFGPTIIKSLIHKVEELGIELEGDKQYSASELQSLFGSIFGEQTGRFMMRFFVGYFQNFGPAKEKE